MTPTREDKIGAAVVTAAALTVAFSIGWASNVATAPATYSSSSYGSSSYTVPPAPTPTTPTLTPTPSPTAVVPAVYGNAGLAAKIAQGEGHDSMSDACNAGVEWACDVTKVEPAVGMTQTWRVSIGEAPLDGDAIARELLDRAPGSVTTVELSYAPHGAAVLIPTPVGHAERPLKR